MKNVWDKFAEDNPQFYILTGDTDYSTEEGKEHFFKTGEIFTRETLENVLPLLPGKERALEIGCGVGRLTLPHSDIFDRIIAVDVSRVMLDRLNRNTIDFNKENIETFKPSEKWDKYEFDYAYSFIRFQHIDSFDIIKDYIIRISKCLREGGILQIQFDTRSPNLFYRIRNKLPDFLLPKTQRMGIRRIRRDAEGLRELFESCNFEIIKELYPDSERHTFLLGNNDLS